MGDGAVGDGEVGERPLLDDPPVAGAVGAVVEVDAAAGAWASTTAASAVAATPHAAVQPVARATRRSPLSRAATRGSGSVELMGPVDRRFLGGSWERGRRA
ncbi:hypothetical protein GCM10023175_62940 [Pseudonocardia xishanensis]|uniref:Uncharacterized protein n=1 Tax=Pseudonocardia xishanensis TaxID=630995 RepID=A0ABP8S1B2_9PSEU